MLDNRSTQGQRGWVVALATLLALGACNEAPNRSTPRSPTTSSERPAPPRSPIIPLRFEVFAVPDGAHPHDVAPSPNGRRIWYTAQAAGALGVLDTRTGHVRQISLGAGSAPHGVVVGPDGAPWITDGGLNAIVRVDPRTDEIRRFQLPGSDANLNTAAFDGRGRLWFTGQNGIYGRVDPTAGTVDVYDAPRGRGPYGIDATPSGTVWFSSLAGSYIARINAMTGRATVVDVPTAGGGARRIWSDSQGRLWVTEWYAGKLARYDPATRRWREWPLPGETPQPYAVYVDDGDRVWVTDFGANALVRFDPRTERFTSFRFPSRGAEVRQLLGHDDAVWGAASGTDELVVLRPST